MSAMEKGEVESLLVEHDKKCHWGLGATFTMKVPEYPNTNLLRKVTEYLQMVHYGERGLLLNRRGGAEPPPTTHGI